MGRGRSPNLEREMQTHCPSNSAATQQKTQARSLDPSATELKDHQRTDDSIEEETTVVHTLNGTGY